MAADKPDDKPDEDFATALRVLLAKQEIHEALVRYCRGIDRCDVDLVLSAFHEDALDNHSGVDRVAYERFPRVIPASKAMIKWTSHNICNELIEVEGEVAHCESYLLSYHCLEHEGRDLDYFLGARYVDRFELRDGAWRIAHRTVVVDWERFDEVGAPPEGLPLATMFARSEHGARAPDDFTYRSRT